VKADRYAHFETAAANYIRKAFKNIPPQLVDYVQGKLGNTTGEDLIKAQSVYNQLTARDRAKVSRLFSILFDGYKMDINPGRNWEIKQYKLLDDGTVN
jgi:glycyl-tRNA synthetase alpha subunit